MNFNLPSANSEISAMFDMDAITNFSNLPFFNQALNNGQKAANQPMVKSVNCLCVRSNGEVWLIEVGPKGGWKRLWNFGKP